MDRFILAGVVIMAVVSVLFLQHSTIRGLRVDLTTANSRIAGYEELSRFNARVKAADVEWSKTEKDLGESDAPLSDYMSGVARRLWP